MAWNSYIGAFGSSSGAQISCSGACSSSSRACIGSSGQRLQSLEAPEALFFSRGLAFSPCGATTLPHINYAWLIQSELQIHIQLKMQIQIQIQSILLPIGRWQTMHYAGTRSFKLSTFIEDWWVKCSKLLSPFVIIASSLSTFDLGGWSSERREEKKHLSSQI